MSNLPINKFELTNGIVDLIMPPKQGARLERTCFRGTDCHQAGNFFAWNNFREFLEDDEARTQIAIELEKLVAAAQVNRNHRIKLEFSGDIGWESTVGVEELSVDEVKACELRVLSTRASALFLPDDLIKAPYTDTVTMVLEMKHVEYWRFIIHTMYPGQDCGELLGNMTEEQKLVWLHWSNPGQQ